MRRFWRYVFGALPFFEGSRPAAAQTDSKEAPRTTRCTGSGSPGSNTKPMRVRGRSLRFELRSDSLFSLPNGLSIEIETEKDP